jgi:hypothetical protein
VILSLLNKPVAVSPAMLMKRCHRKIVPSDLEHLVVATQCALSHLLCLSPNARRAIRRITPFQQRNEM